MTGLPKARYLLYVAILLGVLLFVARREPAPTPPTDSGASVNPEPVSLARTMDRVPSVDIPKDSRVLESRSPRQDSSADQSWIECVVVPPLEGHEPSGVILYQSSADSETHRAILGKDGRCRLPVKPGTVRIVLLETSAAIMSANVHVSAGRTETVYLRPPQESTLFAKFVDIQGNSLLVHEVRISVPLEPLPRHEAPVARISESPNHQSQIKEISDVAFYSWRIEGDVLVRNDGWRDRLYTGYVDLSDIAPGHFVQLDVRVGNSRWSFSFVNDVLPSDVSTSKVFVVPVVPAPHGND